MKNVKRVKDRLSIEIVYLGVDQNRLFILRRADDQFWAGNGEWTSILDSAAIYHDHTIAQKHLRAIQNDRYKGKPRRTFTVEMNVTLVSDDVADISPDVLGLFLADAVRVELETHTHGQGPVRGSAVQLQMDVKTLTETNSWQKRF